MINNALMHVENVENVSRGRGNQKKNNLPKAFIIYYKLIKSFNYLTFKKTK